MESVLAKSVIARFDQGYDARSSFVSLWRSCARYTLPNEDHFNEQVSPGVERTRYILDSTAPRSLELFASFIHTLMNNPASQWIKLGVEGEDPTTWTTDERQWFETVEKMMLSWLATDEADIYGQLHQVYTFLGCFGTSVLYVDEHRGALRVRHHHLDDCVLEEDSGEQVNAVFRKRSHTRQQAIEKWGKDKLGKSFQNEPQDDPTRWMAEKRTFLHFCVPVDDPLVKHLSAKTRRAAKLGGWTHVGGWIDKDDKHIIEEMGWAEMPYIVSRWYKSLGEVYGRSPTMTNLPDIRMVNRMSDTILRGAEKIVDPPIAVKDGGLVSPVRLAPGSITYVEGDTELKTLIPPGTSRIETGNELLKQRQQNIREGYFVPLFVTPDSPVKTATQVLQEVDERNRAVSPMLVRIQTELFHRLINRVYGLLSRSGKLPQMPGSLAGNSRRRIKLEYTSPLIASQRAMDGLALVRLFQTMAPWGQIDPGIFDGIDIDEVGKTLHLASAAPAKVWRSDAKIKAAREERLKRAQEQQQAQMLLAGGDVAAKMAAATKPTSG